MTMDKKDLKIVFLGTPDFAVPSLDRIVSSGYNIVGVVTMPDKPAGRGHRMYMSPVKEYALAHGLHLMQPEKLRDPSFVNELQSLNADLFVVIAFRMLPQVVWQMPRLGTFNLHASLLPDYRGAAPINWAVINGDTHTGVTTFFLKHEIDTGDVIDQCAIDITDEDNVGTVHDRLMALGADLVERTLAHIVAGDLKTTPQSAMASKQCRPAPKISRNMPYRLDSPGYRGTQPCTWPLAIPRRLDHTMRRQSHAYRFQSFCHSRGHRRRHKCESGHHNRRNRQPRRGMRRPSHTAHTQSSSHRQTPHGHRRIPAWCTPIQSAHSLKNPMK